MGRGDKEGACREMGSGTGGGEGGVVMEEDAKGEGEENELGAGRAARGYHSS